MAISRIRIVVASLALLLSPVAKAAPPIWPQFRGPGGSGISALTPPPAEFAASRNLAWSTEIPPGHSSPVIAADRIFLTAIQDGKLQTLALDRATGKVLWQRPALARAIERVHSFASPATPTPLATEDRVVVYFGSFGLICYDYDGKELWNKPLATPKSTYGTACSPIRLKDTAVIVIDSDDRKSRIVAVRLGDGTTAWETDRPLAASCWATPALWEHEGKSEIVVPGARRLITYDGETGKERWWLDGFPVEVIAVPVVGEGMLFVSAAGLTGPPTERFESMSWKDMLVIDRNGDGKIQKSEVTADFKFTLRPELPPENPGRYLPSPFRNMFDGVDANRDGEITEQEFTSFVKQWSRRTVPFLMAIRPGGAGDIAKSHVAWQMHKGIPEIPSPLYHRGRIYTIRDGGFLACITAATGELRYQERIGAIGAYCASPVAAGDRIYVASHNGVVTCIDATADQQLKVIARNELGEKIWATPALGDGTIYVRTEKHLYAFSEKK